MAKLLLDSNALLWVLSEPHKLGRLARQRIERESSPCYSAVTIFELTLKSEIRSKSGKLALTLPSAFSELVKAVGFIEVPLRAEHADLAKSFRDFGSGDPVDRMILAQALHENAALLTSDQKMLAMGRDWIIDAQL